MTSLYLKRKSTSDIFCEPPLKILLLDNNCQIHNNSANVTNLGHALGLDLQLALGLFGDRSTSPSFSRKIKATPLRDFNINTTESAGVQIPSGVSSFKKRKINVRIEDLENILQEDCVRTVSNYISSSPDYSHTEGSFPYKRQKTCEAEISMLLLEKAAAMENLDDQYNSFQYWRDSFPDIRGELCDAVLGVPDNRMDVSPVKEETDDVDQNFNSFNFWRLPLPELTLNLS